MPLESYEWTSYGDYLKAPSQRPRWLRVDRLLGEKRIAKDSPAGRREFARLMEERRAQEGSSDYRTIRRGWCIGSEEFRKELLAAAVERIGANHYGHERQETLQERAERIIEEEIKRLGLDEKDLLGRRKGDKAKVALARRLRQKTTVTYHWIADRLQMGSWGYVANLPKSKREAKV